MTETTTSVADNRVLITVTSKGFLKPVYTFTRGEEVVAELMMKRGLREQGTVRIGSVQYDLLREKALSGLFLMLGADGGIVVSAEKPSAFREEFILSYGTLSIEMRRIKWWKRDFALIWDDEEISSILPRGFFRSKVEVQLYQNLPMEIVGFAYWLAQLMWNRQQAAAAG